MLIQIIKNMEEQA